MTSNIDVSNPEESDPFTILCRTCCVQMAASTVHGMNSNKFILISMGRVLEKLRVPQLSTNPPLIPTLWDLVRQLLWKCYEHWREEWWVHTDWIENVKAKITALLKLISQLMLMKCMWQSFETIHFNGDVTADVCCANGLKIRKTWIVNLHAATNSVLCTYALSMIFKTKSD